MQLKATFAKQSLVNSLDLSLSRQHYAVCVGTLKFQPTMVLQSCFYCSQRKMVLSGVAGPGFLLFLPIWMGSYAHPSAKDTLICGSFNFKFLFPRKPQFCFYGRSKKLILRVTDMIWIFPAFYLIGDIPPSPGDIPRDLIFVFEDPLFYFFLRLQHFHFASALLLNTYFQIPRPIIEHQLSDPIDQLQRCSNSICQFQSSNPGIAAYADVFFVSESSLLMKCYFYRYNQLLCRVQSRMCIAVRHTKPAHM